MAIAQEFDPANFFRKVEVEGRTEIDPFSQTPFDFEFETQSNVLVVEERHLGRPDLISLDAYGDVNYWWVIMLANDIVDPFDDIKFGDELIIPNDTEVFQFLEQFRRT